ncbi:MAG: peptidase MA family metallohydrolase [Candidatus Omnitrophota bacterium]|nr:peptidase MA family metallohydrolase [Candidatus Omnitrophota bacterium]
MVKRTFNGPDIFKVIVTAFVSAIAVFFLYADSVASTFEESFWEVKKSNHFAVFYKSSESNDYVNDVLQYAERYYESITEEFGFTRFEFWTWEKQCKIYLYPTAKEYYDATGQPSWSGATAYLKERTIKTFVKREEFLETILPHEMTHLIFREFVGYNTDLPLWLDEGMASLQEKKNRKQHLLIAAVMVRSNVFIPLTKLTGIQKEGLVMPGVFYAEAASVIEFFLEKYGKEKFVDYCRDLRDNKNWRTSLAKVYGFKDLSEMNKKWMEFLSQTNAGTGQ